MPGTLRLKCKILHQRATQQNRKYKYYVSHHFTKKVRWSNCLTSIMLVFNSLFEESLQPSRCLKKVFGTQGFPAGAVVKNLPANSGDPGDTFDPWIRKIPWRRKQQPTPVFLPREFRGQRSLAGYSSRGRTELDTIELVHTLFFFRTLGGRCSPLQQSCFWVFLWKRCLSGTRSVHYATLQKRWRQGVTLQHLALECFIH